MKTRSQTRLVASRKCRFMELPGELRNQVYSYTLSASMPELNGIDNFERPAILYASKTIKIETLSIYKKQLESALEAGRNMYDTVCGKHYRAMSIMAPISKGSKMQWQWKEFKKVINYELNFHGKATPPRMDFRLDRFSGCREGDKPCYLLKIAAELRIMIYKGVLEGLSLESTLFERPGLLSACQQTHNETLALYAVAVKMAYGRARSRNNDLHQAWLSDADPASAWTAFQAYTSYNAQLQLMKQTARNELAWVNKEMLSQTVYKSLSSATDIIQLNGTR